MTVFAVIWLVTFIFNQVAKLGLNDADTASWKSCWKQIRGK